MKSILCISFLSLLLLPLWSQDYWIKEYDFGVRCDHGYSNIKLINNHIYALGDKATCIEQSVHIYKFDTLGNLLDSFVFAGYGSSFARAFVYDPKNQAFLFTGLKRDEQTNQYHNYIMAVDTNGQQIYLKEITYGDQYSRRAWLYDIKPYKDGFVVYGKVERRLHNNENDFMDGVLTFLHADYSLDTTFLLDEGLWHAIGDMDINKDGKLIGVMSRLNQPYWPVKTEFFVAEFSRDFFWKDTVRLPGFSDHGEFNLNDFYTPWEYHPQHDLFITGNQYNYTKEYSEYNLSMHAYDANTDLVWERDDEHHFQPLMPEGDWIDDSYHSHTIACKNGDILFVGSTTVRRLDLGWSAHRRVPWLMRVNGAGDIIYMRTALINQQDGIPLNWHAFSDAIEMENGDFLVLGTYLVESPDEPRYYRKIFLSRVDPQGCFNPGCGVIDIVSDNSEIPKFDQLPITVQPNPIQDELVIERSQSQGSPLDLKVYDTSGILIHSELIHDDKQVIASESWQSGVYFLHFISAENGTKVIKVVK